MSWFQTVEGDGFFRGFFRRPSTIILIFAIILFVAQLPPLPGIFLMMFGAAFGTGILIDLFLVAFTIEILLGYTPRILLAVPLAIVGAYYGTAIAQRADVAAYAHSLALNETVEFSADHTVLIAFRFAIMNDHETAGGLIDRYGLDSVFVSAPRGGQSRLDRRSAGGCLPPARDETQRPFSFVGENADITRTVELCVTEDVPLPDRRILSATRKRTEADRGYPLTLITTTLWEDGAPRASITGGTARVQSWLPVVTLGCTLISGGPGAGWRCGPAPFRETVVIGPALSATKAIGAMLGLAERI